jgi:hypothetical protein
MLPLINIAHSEKIADDSPLRTVPDVAQDASPPNHKGANEKLRFRHSAKRRFERLFRICGAGN